MTATIVSLALILTPSPITVPKEAAWQPTVISAPLSPTTSNWLFPPPELIPSLFVETPPPASIVSSDTSPASVTAPTTVTPPPPLTLRERVLAKLADLGAPPWVVNAFDCIGWRESGWENKRSRTGDDGTLQINDVHDPELRALGLDPYVPEDAATYAWLLFTRAGWSFRDWTVRGLCGLR